MLFTEAQLSGWLAAFIWPLLRISSMLVASPVFSARQTPNRLRIGLALLLTWVLMPALPVVHVESYIGSEAFLLALQQVLVGLMMGFILQMVFAALVFGGQVMAFSMGLGFASMMDPQNGVQVPVVSQFYLIIATLLFLIFDGHLILIGLVAQSFHTFPVAVDGISRNTFHDIVGWGGIMFSGGVLMA
ncbi:MAG: flagellar biosynthetic protein FliR, partial [Candidatus Sedimenticola endophacoides]